MNWTMIDQRFARVWTCRCGRCCRAWSAPAGLALLLLGLAGTGCVAPRAAQGALPETPALTFRSAAGDQTAAPATTAPTVELERTRPATLADCIRVALAQHPRTRGTWEAMRAAAAGVDKERAAYLPSADLRARAVREKTVPLDSDKENDPRRTYNAGIDVGWLLFDGGARHARVTGAEAEFRNAGFRHNAGLQDLALSVEVFYYELLGAQWRLKVAAATRKSTKYQLELAQARRDAGVVTRADVLRAKTQDAEARLQLVQARNGIQLARGRLARVMGIPVQSRFEIAELPEVVQNRELPRMERLLDEAARQRPELKAALALVAADRAAVSEAQAARWPSLRAHAGGGRKDTHFTPDREEWSIGVTVAVPVFDGGARRRQVDQSRARLARSMAEYADLLQGIELEVWTAYWRLTEAAEAVVAATALTASAGESVRLAENEYKNGVISIVGLIDAQTAQTTAARRLIQARLDWYVAKAQFERAVGRSLIESASPAD